MSFLDFGTSKEHFDTRFKVVVAKKIIFFFGQFKFAVKSHKIMCVVLRFFRHRYMYFKGTVNIMFYALKKKPRNQNNFRNYVWELF